MNSGHLIALVFIPVGIFFMLKYKYWKQNTNSMLYPLYFKLFIGGGMLFIAGIYGLVDGIVKLLK